MVVGCGDDEAPVTADAASADAVAPADADPTRPDAGSAATCGGFAGLTCDDPLWCDYASDNCGDGDAAGVCTARPQACPDVVDPVCGCDGTIYGNTCEAAVAGIDVSTAGGCEPPEQQFGCGPRFCRGADQYCRRDVSDVAGIPDEYRCVALPASCGAAPSCACLALETCGDSCVADAAGNLSVTCPGG
jgi:hypothetical protein